jgi:hypothetical protein
MADRCVLRGPASLELPPALRYGVQPHAVRSRVCPIPPDAAKYRLIPPWNFFPGATPPRREMRPSCPQSRSIKPNQTESNQFMILSCHDSVGFPGCGAPLPQNVTGRETSPQNVTVWKLIKSPSLLDCNASAATRIFCNGPRIRKSSMFTRLVTGVTVPAGESCGKVELRRPNVELRKSGRNPKAGGLRRRAEESPCSLVPGKSV